MNPASQMDHRRLTALSTAIQELYRPGTLADFPQRVVTAVGGLFGSEIVTYNEFRADGGAPLVLSNNGFEKRTNHVEAARPFLTQNPLIARLLKFESVAGSRITDVIRMDDFRRTDIYNLLYRPVGGDYQMGCGFRSERAGTYLGIAVNQQLRDFTDDELFLFNLVIPHAQQAYQICHALEKVRGQLEIMTSALEHQGSGVIVFDDAYRVAAVGGIARKVVWDLFHCAPQENAILPDELLDCVLRLKGRRDGDVAAPQYPLAYARQDGSNVLIRLSIDPERAKHLLVFEHEPGVPGVSQMTPLGLTRREAEVVHWILQGKTNWEIGIILGISGRTIEKHVENIFSKLGINDRRHLQRRISELRNGAK